ncbi:MAG: DUF2156 domain-containing protein [Butyrivibrio sp.]|uniref:phosphatidylglycerol lysyltransferase domain-containing protein n=1 Tax=Butyrivibrio sp. TaxID=28121 RepID=UPI001AFDE1B9|nr:phosphatidylglycerol lysyltransferase domain-containing protein [Butyrivibrio sp.]MBO6240007.1 DUF2156 domain-containing protein [Butyrivibrio sp.]
MLQIATESIDLTMSKAVSKLYKEYGKNDSAHAFNSLYIWAKNMKLSIYLSPDLYAVKLNDAGTNTWFFPVGKKAQKIDFIKNRLKDGEFSLRYMTREDTEFIRESFPECFQIKKAPNDCEYLYDRDTIENLPGKVFSKKRTYVRQLLREHIFETKPLNELTIPDVRYILGIWERNKEKNKEKEVNSNDKAAMQTILSAYSQMDVEGIVIYMDGIPCSAVAGYFLNDDTFDCCLQKSAININGLQYYIRKEFSLQRPINVAYYNWEEDLGIEGLKLSKKIMHPCGMVDMYTGKQL